MSYKIVAQYYKDISFEIPDAKTALLLDKDIKYKGFLYAGLMIVKNNPYLIEYNVRMGDPECQTILPILKSNL